MKLHIPNLLAAMARRGVSQAEFARGLGWSESKLSRMVNEKTEGITLTQISDLAGFLGVSEAALVDLEDVAQTDAEREVLRNFRVAEARDQELARQQLKPRSVT